MLGKFGIVDVLMGYTIEFDRKRQEGGRKR